MRRVRTFEVAEDGATVGAGCYGNALLSRTGFRASRTVALPAAPMAAFVEPAGAGHRLAGIRYADAPSSVREPRCLLLAETNGLTVGSAHFSHIGSGERLLQAEATVAAFADDSPALLLGDLNAAIESPELAPLAELDRRVRRRARRRGPHLDRQRSDGSTTCSHAARRSRTVACCARRAT